jgi:hypothetical protein
MKKQEYIQHLSCQELILFCRKVRRHCDKAKNAWSRLLLTKLMYEIKAELAARLDHMTLQEFTIVDIKKFLNER